MNKENAERRDGRLWSIVLAGGEGRRLAPFIRETFGDERPKQYCTFTGTRSMLEHTVERAAALSGPERVVTVIDKSHWGWLDEPRRLFVPGRIVAQPERRETAPGILLPLALVSAEDPEATVAVLPSDHFIRSNAAFLAEVRRASIVADAFPSRIVLVAARPDRPEEDYGWVAPGEWVVGSGLCARTVRRFVEKPPAREAARMNRAGWLWNTMILVGKARAFWDIARQTRPDLADRFETLRDAATLGRAEEVMPAVYQGMPTVNFSSEMLQRVPERLLALPMTGNVVWCDWGRPERISATLKWLKMEPSFGKRVKVA
ncbi:MAG: NTP transferase domain-containing protein [Elusimicrobia bacterium]|nr:NTP transferase domain-containing protein [Elusimicrobiota bacterium]